MKEYVSIENKEDGIDITEELETPLEVLLYDNPVLRKASRKVKYLDDETIQLIQDMAETMLIQQGIGLAAPQVGVSKRIFTFITDFASLDSDDDEISVKVAINPQILEREGEIIAYEGCLSYPDHVAYVNRAMKVKVRYQNMDMEKVEEEYTGLAARVFQHELDHLEGILFIDRMEPDSLKHVDELKKEDESEDDLID